MNDRLRDLLAWLDDRTAFRTIRHHLLDEPLPPGTGWWFTLGSVLLFGLGVQVVTGIALALFYAPTPDHAWESVRFITTMIPGGHILRGLHHWGASVVVVAALVHLVRVVFFGSYRKPRELNWIVGLILLQVILAFGLTGYLLPWDQRSYWATVVAINISKLTPLVGESVAALLVDHVGGRVGVRGAVHEGRDLLGEHTRLRVVVEPLDLDVREVGPERGVSGTKKNFFIPT